MPKYDLQFSRSDETTAKAAEPRRRRRRPLDQRVMDATGHEWCGSHHPPLDHWSRYVKDDGVYRVFATTNDGFDVGIGYPDEWHVIMRMDAARSFARWVFVLWLWDWFGLRSRIYYVALNHSVKGKWKLRPYGKRKQLTRLSSFDEWRAEHPPEPRRRRVRTEAARPDIDTEALS